MKLKNKICYEYNTHIFKPGLGVLEITNRCNLQCKHCYIVKKNFAELDITVWEKIINDLSINGCEFIIISGGEPFLFHNLWEILKYCVKKGIKTVITSNGTLIKKEDIQRLKDSGISGIQISIDGNKKEHENIRGFKTYKDSLKIIENLVSQGLRTSTCTTLLKINLHCIEKMIKKISQLEVSNIGFERFTPIGNGDKLHTEVLSKREILTTYEKIFDLQKFFKIKINDPLRILVDSSIKENAINLSYGGCLAGIATFTISSAGDLKLCPRLPHILGNLINCKFEKMWFGQRNILLKDLRNREIKGKCGSCEHLFLCAGCRAEAFALKKDLFEEEPFCWKCK